MPGTYRQVNNRAMPQLIGKATTRRGEGHKAVL